MIYPSYKSSPGAQMRSLIDAQWTPTELFARLSDSIFFYIDANPNVAYPNTGYVEPDKYMWWSTYVHPNQQEKGLVGVSLRVNALTSSSPPFGLAMVDRVHYETNLQLIRCWPYSLHRGHGSCLHCSYLPRTDKVLLTARWRIRTRPRRVRNSLSWIGKAFCIA